MLKLGKITEIAREINKYIIDVVGLQEARWRIWGRLFGTAIMLNAKMRKSLLDFEPIN